MASYQDHMLDGASPVDLVVALYDGIIRFLYAAIHAVEQRDIDARRTAVKRALAIVIHLQARLRMDIGGRPAEVLAEFYASIFALILQASVAADARRFEHVIHCVRELRDAWRQVAVDASQRKEESIPKARLVPFNPVSADSDQASRWTA